MYSGFSKNNGSVIGDTSMAVQVDMGEAGDSTAAEESLICMDENGDELVLNARIDPASGDLGWCQLYSKDEIMERTVGMSQMTSMLRDTDRNSVYERAIGVLIQNFVNDYARQPMVLDVGCGTGLLSMLAVRQGAEFVIGCEMFTTMANIAERVVGSNDFGDRILVVNAKSSEVEDLPVQPDLLISELLDSALLGEGCVPAHADAISRLLNPFPGGNGMQEDEETGQEPDFANRVLPYSGLVYATLVQSTEVRDMHDVQSIALGKGLHMHRTPVEETDASSVCLDGRHLVPVHWAQLKSRGATEISVSASLLHVNFTQTAVDATTGFVFAQPDEWQFSDIVATEDGTVHGVLLHWTLYLLSPALDPQRQCTYSTAPGAQNWQDHWQQTVYPLPRSIGVRCGEVVRVYAMHDGVTIHLHAEKVAPDTAATAVPEAKRPRCDVDFTTSQQGQMVPCGEDGPAVLYDDCRTLCRCGWHVLCGAERFQAMCDAHRGQTWAAVLETLVASLPQSGVVMDVGDGSLLGLSVAAKLQQRGTAEGADSAQPRWHVVSRETKQFSRLFFSQLADANGLDHALVWDGADLTEVAEFINPTEEPDDEDDQQEQEVDLAVLSHAVKAVISECSYYQLTALPAWQALGFYFQVQSLRNQGLLHTDCHVLPGKALLRAIALELPQLRNCHGLADMVSGFDHAELDAQQQLWHTHIYPYKLSAYEYTALTEAVTLGVLDYAAIPSGPGIHHTTAAGEADLVSGEVVAAALQTNRVGSCDAVAIWVDYELTPGNYLCSYENGRFAHHLTANIKFFPTPRVVEAGQTVRARVRLNPVKTDFDYEFAFA